MASEKAAETTRNLKIDPPSKASNINMAGPKDGSTSDATSCISSVDATNSTKESDLDQEALMAEQGMYYPANGLYGYYYPGFDGSVGEWDGQGYYAGADGLEIQHSANQADNGSVMYYFPGFQPDYNPYNPYMPGAMINVDGQYLGQQLYYPSSMYSQQFVSPGIFPQTVAYGSELVPAYAWDSSSLVTDGLYGAGYGGDRTFLAPKNNFSSQTLAHAPSKTPPPLKSTTEKKGSSPTLDVSSVAQDQTFKPINKAASVLSKGFISINKLSSSPNQGKSGTLYPHNTGGIKETGRNWVGTEKLKARNNAHGSGDFDMLIEQNRGPRTNGARSTWSSEADSVGSLGTEGNDDSDASIPLVRKDDYNLPDFSTKYDHALFFVIKSYSEDDIHKSIKYNVWASTPNGNKRLDNAFQVAQERAAEKGSKCPVFLFFSVNASGQFCGVAEMIGRVDFCKNMDFWQQDKWTGFFPVKWHIIKDIPNPQFRHIILENNENKPVTNSRDTQEVKFRQGTEVLSIFKSYSSKTSILDDFSFYENRQKAMQDKRIKLPTPNTGNFSIKPDDKAEASKADDLESVVSSLQSIELAASDSKEPPPVGVEVKKE